VFYQKNEKEEYFFFNLLCFVFYFSKNEKCEDVDFQFLVFSCVFSATKRIRKRIDL
jgi:hypothetical protein